MPWLIGMSYKAIRTRTHKYIHWTQKSLDGVECDELYDLKADPGERTNLAAAQPERVARMQAKLQDQARDAAAPLFFKEAVGAAKPILFGSVATPEERRELATQP
jgi:arylsulfatase A-like enzyme